MSDKKPFLYEHTVKVLSVEDEGDGDYDVEIEIDHGKCKADPEECLISQTINDLGWQQASYGVWSKIKPQVGTFIVVGWEEKHDVPGMPIEWDAGIEVVREILGQP